jgi:hypothetical protein
MNYHLNRQGASLGVFTLEELRQRRQAGELDGSELVWREGMPQWQPLDYVLENPAIAQGSQPAKTPSPHIAVWIIITIVLGGIGVAVLIGYSVVKGVKQQAASLVSSTRNYSSDDEGASVARQPIVVPATSRTERMLKRTERAFRDRQWVEGYRLRGNHDQPCDKEVIPFLTAWLDLNYSTTPVTNGVDVTRWADKLAENPACNEPLLLTAAGGQSVEVFEAIRRYEKALKLFPSSRHLAYPQWNAGLQLADHLSDKGRIAALDATSLKLFEQCFKDGSFRPEDQGEIGKILLDAWGAGFFNRNDDAVAKVAEGTGQPYDWLAKLLRGQYHINEAWRLRGGGYVDTVTEKGWQGFRENMDKAKTALTAAWRLNPAEPRPASKMITVGMGQGGAKEMRIWFDRAVAAQIDDSEAWQNFRWGLRPRWHGSLEAMRQLGVLGLNTGRFDTDVPRKLFDAVSELEQELKTAPGTHIYGRADIWPDLERMYRGYLAEPSQAAYRPGWRASFAVVSYFAGRYDVAREQLQELSWKPPLSSLDNYGTDLTLMALEVAARTSGQGSEVAAAEGYYWSGDVHNARQAYEKLVQSMTAGTPAADFVQHRIASLALEERLASGEWTDFLPARQDDPNWQTLFGKSRFPGNGALEVGSGREGHLLYCRSRVTGDFEVKGQFEVVRTSNASFQAGSVMGMPDLNGYNWYGFRIKRNPVEKDIATFAKGWGTQQVYQPAKINDVTNAFLCRLAQQKVTATVNGVPVLQEAKIPASIYPRHNEFYVGLGAYGDSNETTIRYRNIQVRRILGGRRPSEAQ